VDRYGQYEDLSFELEVEPMNEHPTSKSTLWLTRGGFAKGDLRRQAGRGRAAHGRSRFGKSSEHSLGRSTRASFQYIVALIIVDLRPSRPKEILFYTDLMERILLEEFLVGFTEPALFALPALELTRDYDRRSLGHALAPFITRKSF